jgi:methionyl-tRNA synthetase
MGVFKMEDQTVNSASGKDNRIDSKSSCSDTSKTLSPSANCNAGAQPTSLPGEDSSKIDETSTPEIDIQTFAKVELRVATITQVEAVPKSKKLFKIQLDVGPLGTRQIVSGIAKHYTPEDLTGRQIIVVANLKPVKLMGVESKGMLLAASTDGDETLAILNPDKPLPAGSLVR